MSLLISLFFLLITTFPFYCQEAQNITVDSLLDSYLKNDSSLQNAVISLSKSELNKKLFDNQNAFCANLTTGSIIIRDKNVSFSPKLQFSVPKFYNISTTLSSEIKFTENESSIQNTQIDFSIDLLSFTNKNLKLSELKNNRQITQAKRTLYHQGLNAEKEFYSILKELYSTQNALNSAKTSLYEDTIDFEEIKTQGYSSSSSKYRSAELKVLTDKHNVESKERQLLHKCMIFASKCGISLKEDFNIEKLLPKEIPEVQSININSFEKENFTKIEEALWTKFINEQERNANINYALKAHAGYTIDNTISNYKYDTANVGASFSYQGISLLSLVSIPTTSLNTESILNKPYYSVSLSFDPNTFINNNIQNKVDLLSKESEELLLKDAYQDYQTAVIQQENSLSDILWSIKSNTTNYQLYSELEKDMQQMFNQGLINQSEYLQTKTNKENYKILLLINYIDLIIYNNSTKLLFYN